MVLPEQSIRDRYRWETRKVTGEGLVSVDGIRYGVPWQYSGKEVQVRLHDGFVEIYTGEILLARHDARHNGSRILWLKGQYKGLSTAGVLLDAHLEGAVHEEMTYVRFLEELLSSEQYEGLSGVPSGEPESQATESGGLSLYKDPGGI